MERVVRDYQANTVIKQKTLPVALVSTTPLTQGIIFVKPGNSLHKDSTSTIVRDRSGCLYKPNH